MDKLVKLGEHFSFKYTNFRMRPMTNEERFEANIRSDFRARKVPEFDRVEVVRNG